MLLRRVLLTLSLIAVLATGASAQVKFERKLREGTRTVETTSRSEQKLSLGGMDIDSGSDSKITTKVTTNKRDDVGNVRVQEKIEGLQVTTRQMGIEYNFDSANPDQAGQSQLEILRPIQKASLGRVTTTTFDKENKIASIEFDQDVLAGVPEQIREMVKGEYDVERIKQTKNEELKQLPTDAVKKGDSWDRTQRLNLGFGQLLTVVAKMTYEGEVEHAGRKVDKISVKVISTEFSIDNPSFPLQVKQSSLKPTESKGEVLFDRELGLAVSNSSLMTIVGEITFVANNMEIPAKLELTMESKTTSK
ncbi:MAG: DUF6263 family protein [Planctomycetales bacterium]